MERYQFSEEERNFIERSSIPFAIYQFIDKRVVTVALSEGLRQLIGTDTIEEAMALMDDDMYRDIHPDDIAKTASAALKFATEDAKYDDFLGRYHLDDRSVLDESKFVRKEQIDYRYADQKLEEDRKFSLDFLKSALEKC